MEQQKDTKIRKNSKAKGSGFESKVAKLLTEALKPLNFIRTQGSGARVGGRNFETIGKLFGEDALKIFVGDVVPVNTKDVGIDFIFSIETKFYAKQDTFTSLAAGTANIFSWYREAVEDAKKIGRVPMLIWKWNHTPIFAAVDCSAQVDQLLTAKRHQVLPKLTLISGDLTLDIFYLEDLLKVPQFWYNKQ